MQVLALIIITSILSLMPFAFEAWFMLMGAVMTCFAALGFAKNGQNPHLYILGMTVALALGLLSSTPESAFIGLSVSMAFCAGAGIGLYQNSAHEQFMPLCTSLGAFGLLSMLAGSQWISTDISFWFALCLIPGSIHLLFERKTPLPAIIMGCVQVFLLSFIMAYHGYAMSMLVGAIAAGAGILFIHLRIQAIIASATLFAGLSSGWLFSQTPANASFNLIGLVSALALIGAAVYGAQKLGRQKSFGVKIALSCGLAAILFGPGLEGGSIMMGLFCGLIAGILPSIKTPKLLQEDADETFLL